MGTTMLSLAAILGGRRSAPGTGPRRATRRALVAVTAGFAAMFCHPSTARAQSAGAASSFAVVGGSAVSANGSGSVITGDVGVSPGTAITGFPSAAHTVPPYNTHSNDGAAINAQAATTALYIALGVGGAPIPDQLDTQNLVSGTYTLGAADLANNGTLTLNGAGVYIFRVASSLVANVGSHVALLGGADACSVYWQVTSAATLNGVNFAGTVVAQAAVTLGVGDALTGRALTTSLGAVTLSGGNSISGCSSTAVPPSPPPPPPPPSPTPSPSPRPNACAATSPDLFIVKTHTNPFVTGTNATYSIAVGNNGVTSIGPITVTDTLPATLTFVSAGGVSWSCAAAGQVVTCTSSASIPGSITLIVRPGVDAVPAVTNNAVVSGGGDCDLTNNATADVAIVTPGVSSPVPVPTLSEWAMMMLAVLLAVAGGLALRRRSSS